MNVKAFSKKLVLNKKTIANLNHNEMRDSYGGKPDPSLFNTCPTIGTSEINCCPCGNGGT